MLDEARGQISIPVAIFPADEVLVAWIPLNPTREGLPLMEALVQVHYSTRGKGLFEAPQAAGYAEDPPWESRDVLPDDYWRLPPEIRPLEEEQHGMSAVFSEFFNGRLPAA
jgi:hypothetical protein